MNFAMAFPILREIGKRLSKEAEIDQIISM